MTEQDPKNEQETPQNRGVTPPRKKSKPEFRCEACGKLYADCKCKVYMSKYAKGRTEW